MINTLALFVFPMLMAFAASSDLLTMRISNRLVLALMFGFVVMAVVVDMSAQQFALHVAAGVLVLIVAFGFFAMHWIGGGDAKLAAATALWLGFSLTLPYVIYGAVLGGALTIGILLLRRWPLPLFLCKVTWIDRLHNRHNGVPYGIALAVSGLLIYPETAIFQHLMH